MKISSHVTKMLDISGPFIDRANVIAGARWKGLITDDEYWQLRRLNHLLWQVAGK